MCIKFLSENILSLNFIEINDLIKELENKLNIKTDLISTLNQKTVTENDKTASSENPQKIEIILTSIKPDKKISVLKAVKSLLNTGLKESKEIVENLPHKIKETTIIKESEDLKEQLETAGGVIELKKILF
jgi:large subunit ribosomal protein L7/L12